MLPCLSVQFCLFYGVPFRGDELRPERDSWVMFRMRLASACHAQSQTCIVQGIQEAGHVVVPHP
jgi:hypothetical protein